MICFPDATSNLPNLSSLVQFLSCTITLECGRGLQRIFRVTIWYPHRSTVWGDFEISLGSGLGFKNLRAVVVPELSNGFATSKQKSNSLSWMADVPQVYLCYAEHFLSFFFFPLCDLSNDVVGTCMEGNSSNLWLHLTKSIIGMKKGMQWPQKRFCLLRLQILI